MGKKKKNKAAAALGRKGGLARKKNLTSAQLSEQAKKAVTARWEKYRQKTLKAESEGK